MLLHTLADRYADTITRKREAVPIGLSLIDDATGGIVPGRFVVVAGRTGQGKSTVALYAAINAAKHGTASAYISLEDPPREVLERTVSFLLHIPSDCIRQGKLTPGQISKIKNLSTSCTDLPLHCIDAVGWTMEQIVEHIEILAEKGVKVLWVDYLQLIYCNGVFSDRRSQINFILRKIKETAILYNMVLIFVAQARRPADVDKEFSGPPRPYEMQESSAIEQGAQLILGVWDEGVGSIGMEIIKSNVSPRGQRASLQLDGGVWRYQAE